jgi:Xaa-Pro aminopeptidase
MSIERNHPEPGGDMKRLPFAQAVTLLTLLVVAAAPAAAQISNEEYAERRAALARVLDDALVLGMGSAAPPQDYISFHQNSPFRYLTGFTEPDAALVMVVEGGEVAHEILFVLPRDPAQETWEGYRVGPDGAPGETGIEGRSVEELGMVVDSIVSARGVQELHVVGPYNPRAAIANDVTQRVDALLEEANALSVVGANNQVAQLRGVKSDAELDLLRKTTAITVQAHREAMRAMEPGMNEFEIQALVEYTFRRYGSERPAFASIVGSGPNSTVLHYNQNDRFMEDGDVVVVDIGAAFGGYAADITRTLPVNGRFSEAQRDIYQLVRDAQAAAEEMARPGASVAQMNQVAAMVLAQGLAELGLIEAPDATYETENGQQVPQLRLFYMHGLGHGIGLDVHDPWPNVLEPGVAFTIEPGIYVRPNLFDEVIPDTPRNREMIEAIRPAFERYVNIGVRIEDDYIVTADGVEWISPAPREIDEIEALMAEPWDGPEPRNAEWVEWYRGTR